MCTGCLCVLCMATSTLPSRLCMSSMFWLSWTSLSMWKAAGQSVGRLCQRPKLWEQTLCKDKFTHAVNTTEHRWSSLSRGFAKGTVKIHTENLTSYLKPVSASVSWLIQMNGGAYFSRGTTIASLSVWGSRKRLPTCLSQLWDIQISLLGFKAGFLVHTSTLNRC